MFGGFEASYQGNAIFYKDARSKIAQLLSYMLLRRPRMIPRSELADAVLEDGEYDNPSAVVNNLIYRLRRALASSGMGEDVIIHEKNSYALIIDAECDIDTESFIALERVSQDPDKDERERFEICLRAMELYRGDLLKNAMSAPWVMYDSLRFSQMYLNLAKTTRSLAEETQSCERALGVLKHAAELFPYDEEMAAVYIYCLCSTNRIKEARIFYDRTVGRLMDDLGVNPSDHLTDAYAGMAECLRGKTETAYQARQSISELEPDGGAFCSNLEAFSHIYKFTVRQMERTGQSVFLMLCTLTEHDGSVPTAGDRMTKVTEAFHGAIKKTLRSSDVYTRYSPSQFLVLLTEITHEDCDAAVASRLRGNFHKYQGMSRVRLDCKYVSAADMMR